ncbi:uncharacterized protein LOC108681411 [Hyalella azteca]|uniref:Uncharacterized protein LOC108681411 n=1 Tax=Hyalella azteca TaxID=294128 RepID=A0A8B7PID9_HYAAZ|nr:uncharacterized protein LOC108681411 [Hyalella azteca]
MQVGDYPVYQYQQVIEILKLKMSFRDKQSRNLCYASRDRYWECLDAVPLTRDSSSDGNYLNGGTQWRRNGTCSNDSGNEISSNGISNGQHRSLEGGQTCSKTMQSDASKDVTRPASHQAKYGARLQANTSHDGALKPCMELRRLCQASCPEHWVKHFDRKRQYLLFREKVAAVGMMDSAGDSSRNRAQIADQPSSTGRQDEARTPQTARLRSRTRETTADVKNRYSLGSCLPDINIIPALPELSSSSINGNLTGALESHVSGDSDSKSRLQVPGDQPFNLFDNLSLSSLICGRLSRTVSDSSLSNLVGNSSSTDRLRISRSSNEISSYPLERRYLSEKISLDFQKPFASSSSLSTSISGCSSLAPPTAPTDLSPPTFPTRQRRVYSQAVLRQRLVPTN